MRHYRDQDPVDPVKAEAEALEEATAYVTMHPLMPCPFCGGPAKVRQCGYVGYALMWVDWITVGCVAVDCRSWLSEATMPAVVAKWHRRTAAGMMKALEAIYELTEGSADGAPDASAHDRLANEIAGLAHPWRK